MAQNDLPGGHSADGKKTSPPVATSKVGENFEWSKNRSTQLMKNESKRPSLKPLG